MSNLDPDARLRIFLSYGHDANEALVRRILTDLEQRGHQVWFDHSDIKSGHDWRRAIMDGIIASDRVLSFLSKHSVRDPGVCRDEIAIAIAVKGGNIQTILVEDESEVKAPVNVSHIQWHDMHDWNERLAAGDEAWYAGKLAEIIRVLESDEGRRFAGEIATLSGYLRPIRFDSRIHELLSKGFCGRTWLFDAVEQWRQDAKRDSRLLWIVGDPGVGKSAFAGELVQTRSDVVIGAHFVEWDQAHHRDVRRVVRSIAFQLATRLPDYRKLLLQLPEIGSLDDNDAAGLFEYLLANPLRSVIDGGRERYLVVIDALDEAGEGDRNPLVALLARHAPRLPEWLAFVVTSRPEAAVTTSLQGLDPVIVDTRTNANLADLRDYVRSQLAVQLREHLDADRRVEQIVEKSEGVFLYVERFCEDVRQHRLSLDHPEQFPQGLGGIFHQWFQRQFPDLEEFRKHTRPALRAILAAREPLPLAVIQSLFDWQDEEVQDFVRTLGSLFHASKSNHHDVITPYHKALADWLADRPRAGPYHASVPEGHKTLAEFCIRELGRSTYARRHVADHCLAVGRAANDFGLLFRTITPRFIIHEATSPQAFSDNACCLEALAAQGRAANPARRLAHALLASLLRGIAEEGYRTGAYILDRAQRRDYSASSTPPALQAAILLLLAEAALIHGDDSTARKLIDEATTLPLACWRGLKVDAFQAQVGTNLPPDSPFLQDLQRHPLTVYLGHLAAYDPEAALRVAAYVCPRREALPNLATLWLAVLEAVPATANADAMERLFTFTDRHVRDFCKTTNDYRELMDRYLTAIFRNKDRFSDRYIGNAVVQSTNSLLTHLREAFGVDWAFTRLLRGMAQLLTPPTEHPEMAGVYHQCAEGVVTIVHEEMFQKGEKVAIQAFAYFLRLRFEAGLPIDGGMLRSAVTYAFDACSIPSLRSSWRKSRKRRTTVSSTTARRKPDNRTLDPPAPCTSR
jgi:TIR domain/NACHT domain